MDTLLSNFRVGFRALRRTPGFAFTAMLTLSLGIGLCTAVFTVADTLLLKRLPVREQERVVSLAGAPRDRSIDNYPLSHAGAREFARRSRALERVALVAYEGAWPVVVRDGDRTQRMRRALVSGEFFNVLGAVPVLGRALGPDDDVRGAAPVAVLSFNAWQTYFGGDSNAVGRQVTVHETGTTLRVIGVMPPGLEYPRGVDIWAAVVPSRTIATGDVIADVTILGRLARNASVETARQDLDAYYQRADSKTAERSLRAVVHSLDEVVVGDTKPALLAFSAAALLLLIIACINVASLLLVRGVARVREVAVRSALGASRMQIVVQLLTENALLALGGALGGVCVAGASIRAFIAFAPADIPRLAQVDTNGAALASAVVVSALAMAVFALAPAVMSSRVELNTTLRAGVRETGDRRSRSLAESLVAGQLALAVIVLSASALVAQTLFNLERAKLSFDSSRLLVAELAIRFDKYNDLARQNALLDALTVAFQSTPGVMSVSPVVAAPFSGAGGWDGRLAMENQSTDESAHNAMVNMDVVSPEYFATMQMPVIKGRAFTNADRDGAPLVAVISQAMARAYWPGQDAIGKRLSMNGANNKMLSVVGIVPDTRFRELRAARASIYFPLRQSQFPFVPTQFVIRTRSDPEQVIHAIRRSAEDAAPGVTIANAASFDTYLRVPLAQPRLNAMLLAVFGAASVTLAAIGLFSVLATMVKQSTRELGIRMALGATASNLRAMVVGRGMRVTAVGVCVGIVASLAASRAMQSLLYDVSPTDGPTLALVVIGLVAIAAAACIVPAVQSTRVSPMTALRDDM